MRLGVTATVLKLLTASARTRSVSHIAFHSGNDLWPSARHRILVLRGLKGTVVCVDLERFGESFGFQPFTIREISRVEMHEVEGGWLQSAVLGCNPDDRFCPGKLEFRNVAVGLQHLSSLDAVIIVSSEGWVYE